jgi:thioredoxin reductase
MVYPRKNDELPVAVIGGGPIGMVAAAHLVSRGITPLVLEAGDGPGASIRSWGHVRVFSPWKYMVDPVSRAMLERTGWRMPAEDGLPTGDEFVGSFLEPLASLPGIEPHVRYNHRVVAVTRHGFDKVKSTGREDLPFEVICRDPRGREVRVLARAVIDASGTWSTASPLGSGGLPAGGERELADHIVYGIPDVRGRDRGRYAGRRILVVGSGHSAFNSLLDLAWLKTEVPETHITWAIRRSEIGLLFGGGVKDELPARGSLGLKLRQLVELGVIDGETRFRATHLRRDGDGVRVAGDDRSIGPVHEIIVATGFRPDLDMLREVRLAVDPVLESPVALAPLIDPNVHSCGTVYPHGHRELRHPERDFFIVGMKSYGRAPNFLLLTGYEQVRSVVAALAGDSAGADSVELVLPETGVCSSDLVGGSACCTTAEPTAGSAAFSGAAAGASGGCGCG